MLCVQECPANAISDEQTVRVTIAGREVEWGCLDADRCAVVYQAGVPEYSPFIPEHVADFVKKLISMPPGEERSKFLAAHGGAWHMGKDEVPYNRAGWESFHHPGAICGARGCMRACMIHLEEQGKLSNRFRHPFRRRPPWRLHP